MINQERRYRQSSSDNLPQAVASSMSNVIDSISPIRRIYLSMVTLTCVGTHDKFYILHIVIQCTTVAPQAHPMMLLASV